MSIEIEAIFRDTALTVATAGVEAVVAVPFAQAGQDERFWPLRKTPIVCGSVQCSL